MKWVPEIYRTATSVASKVAKFGYNVTCSLLDITKASLIACGNTSVEMVILLSLSLISDEDRLWARLYILLTVCAAGSVETIHQLIKSLPRETILSLLEHPQQQTKTNYEWIVNALKSSGKTAYLGMEQIDELARYYINVIVANNYRVPLTARLFYIIFLNLGLSSEFSLMLALGIGATTGITELMQSDLPAMIDPDYLKRIGHKINPETFAIPERTILLRITYSTASLIKLSFIQLTKAIDKKTNCSTTVHMKSMLNFIENKYPKISLALGQATDATIGLNMGLLLFELIFETTPLFTTILSTSSSVMLFTTTFAASYATNRTPTGIQTNAVSAGNRTLLGYLLNTTMIACPNQFLQTLISTFLAQQFLYTITTCAIYGCTNEVPLYYGILTALTSSGLSIRDSIHVLGAGLDEAIKIYNVTRDKNPDEALVIIKRIQRLLLLNHDAKEQAKAPTTVVIKIECSTEMQNVKTKEIDLSEPLITYEEYVKPDDKSDTPKSSCVIN